MREPRLYDIIIVVYYVNMVLCGYGGGGDEREWEKGERRTWDIDDDSTYTMSEDPSSSCIRDQTNTNTAARRPSDYLVGVSLRARWRQQQQQISPGGPSGTAAA